MKEEIVQQPSLFDQPVEPAKEAVVLDIEQARAARDEGIATAESHADHVSHKWSDRAYDFLIRFMETHDGPFMMEQVRSHAAELDFDLPPSNKAWGGVMMRASKAGLVEKLGYQSVKNPKAHCAPCGVWKKVS